MTHSSKYKPEGWFKPTEVRFLRVQKRHYIALFTCFCGVEFEAYRGDVGRGHTSSCGCLQFGARSKVGRANATHRNRLYLDTGKQSPTYVTWYCMKARCLNPNSSNYHTYGGKGITVCEAWMTFEGFLADMGERPSTDYSIDRIDSSGNYEPGNCEWVTKSENSRRSNVKKESTNDNK